jgi:hypothetical protein
VLFEKKFGVVVPTLEGAYYKYKLGAVDCGTLEPGSVACGATGNNIGGQVDGKAYLFGAGLLFTQQVGWGQFQPFVRYQKYERALSNTTSKATDFGLNYIIKGPNAKVSAVYTKFEDSQKSPSADDQWQFLVGVQLIY